MVFLWDDKLITVDFNTGSLDDYRRFLAVRRLPEYEFRGSSALVPERYASLLGVSIGRQSCTADVDLLDRLFDYQRDISALAIRKQKYAVFADCGLGKTLIILEFAKHCHNHSGGRVLIVSPLMVCQQTIDEADRWYGDSLRVERVKAADIQQWLDGDGACVGITNYESIRDGLHRGNLSALILDESSMLKSHYGAWGTRLIDLGRGLDWKMCATGTPAPNDRIEYANHAVFLDRARTVNEFLATYFINRGQTQNRWELKPHALKPFYRSLSDWSIFLTKPATYGWKDNNETTPPIHIHVEHVELTPEQRKAAQCLTGDLITNNIGGIGMRGKLSRIAKGRDGIPSLKPQFIRDRVDSWPSESTIIWCHYNDEQDELSRVFPKAVSIDGATKENARQVGINRFKSGDVKVLITKPKILGFGLNLQVCTRQVFSGLKDSYEEFYQAVKRSNRIGSIRPLNVHIPVTELEVPFVENVLSKAARVESDTEAQESLFREIGVSYEGNS